MRILFLVLAVIVAAPISARGQQAQPQAVTLGAAIDAAVSRHPTVVAAARSRDAAQARLVQARAGRGLEVSLGASASIGTLGPTGAVLGSTDASHDVSIGATYPLYDGGVLQQQILQAQAAVEAAQAALEAARQDVALTAAEAYFDVLQAQRTVEVREAAVQTAQAQVRQAEAFFRAGTAAQADVIRARAAAARAEADLVGARGQVETTLASLRAAMALALTQPVAVADPAAPAVPTIASADAIGEATRQRPEVHRADADIRGAAAALRIAEIRAGLQVNLNANASMQVTPDPGKAGWSISATVSHPLLDGGRSKAALEEARANTLAAAARREATVLQVQTQAHQAAIGVASAAARAEAERLSSAAAEESLRVSEGRYRAGVGTLVEVLDAQSAATEARIAAVQALYDLHLVVVNLGHALGRPLSAQR